MLARFDVMLVLSQEFIYHSSNKQLNPERSTEEEVRIPLEKRDKKSEACHQTNSSLNIKHEMRTAHRQSYQQQDSGLQLSSSRKIVLPPP